MARLSPLRTMMACALLLAASAAYSAGEATSGISAARLIFQEVQQERRNADDAVAAFERQVAAGGPTLPLALAYLGAAQTLQGRDAWMPWTKLKRVERGLDAIDKALRLIASDPSGESPIGLETRLVAISTFLAVPDRIFHRADRGRRLLRETLASPAFAAAPGTLRAEFHRQAAGLARHENNVREEAEQLRLLLAADAAGPLAAAARDRLKELPR